MSIATATLEMTVGQMVVERPLRARIFEKLGIDYCCGGKRPLADACDEKGLDLDAVLAQLAEVDAARPTGEQDWASASMTELADHIEQDHHAYLRQELPRLDTLTEKIARVHGPNHPELVKLREVFVAVRAELESHMLKEERILFPLCRELDQPGPFEEFHCGSVQNPIRVMLHEHDFVGNALATFRELTDGYTPPLDACNTYRATLASLAELEADTHLHIHKENNILFPKAIAAEAARRR